MLTLFQFVTCFPAGFSTRDNCGQPLASIHKPVPGYKAKLEKSMDRYFAKMEVGQAVKRANWSISTNEELFSESGNHFYTDEEHDAPTPAESTGEAKAVNLDDDIERQARDVVIEDCRLRCERQTLHRLPNTKALIFGVKTYTYHLSELKAEGLGHDLATAIDGLALGSIPAIDFYKRRPVWGSKVQEYLLS